MKNFPFLLLALSILAEVVATSFLKASEGFTKLGPCIVVIGGYGASFYYMSLALKYLPIGMVYAIWSGVGIVLISLIGYFFYHQKLNFPTLLGIGFIVVGVMIIQCFSQSVQLE